MNMQHETMNMKHEDMNMKDETHVNMNMKTLKQQPPSAAFV